MATKKDKAVQDFESQYRGRVLLNSSRFPMGTFYVFHGQNHLFSILERQ